MQAVLASSGEELALNIKRLCSDETQREGVLAADGHLALITLLHAGAGSSTTDYAACALVELSCLKKAKVPIIQAGVAAPIVALLRTAPTASSEVLLSNAAALVNNLASTSAAIKAFQKAGAIVPLVSLLGAAPLIARQAAGARATSATTLKPRRTCTTPRSARLAPSQPSWRCWTERRPTMQYARCATWHPTLRAQPPSAQPAPSCRSSRCCKRRRWRRQSVRRLRCSTWPWKISKATQPSSPPSPPARRCAAPR